MALQALEKIGRASSVINVTKNDNRSEDAPSIDEIDEITIVMKRFLAKLRVQLASARFSGSPSRSPPARTAKQKTPPTVSSQRKDESAKRSDDKNAPAAISKSGMAASAQQQQQIDSNSNSADASTTPLNTPRDSGAYMN
ncbi:unnamed protein product [Anisakis simplex]|uniref:Tymo-45kd-70kd multi-domain protein n=1 Tax=Anisakis simplex TaxID=6269 RepID=A0A0M3JFV6_ANISI|nr:unnamed protein product [Anisakis simplex]